MLEHKNIKIDIPTTRIQSPSPRLRPANPHFPPIDAGILSLVPFLLPRLGGRMSFAPSAAGRTMLVVLAFVCVIRTQAANAATYTWNGGASAAWTNAASWSPARNSPATSDVLQFTGGGTTTATSVPTQTIGQLTVSNNTTLTLQQVSNATLTIAGGSGVDLSVAAGSSLSAGPNFGPLHVFIGAGATAD